MSLKAAAAEASDNVQRSTSLDNLNSISQSTSTDDDEDQYDDENADEIGEFGTAVQQPGPSRLQIHRSRVMFLDGESEKLLEFGQQCSQTINEEVQTLLTRFESQKSTLERLMKSEEHSQPSAIDFDTDEQLEASATPVGLSEDTVQLYLQKLRRLMQEFSRAVSQSSLRPPPSLESATGACRTRRYGRRRRVWEAARPLRVLNGVEALDIALVVNADGRMHYRLDGGGLAYFDVGTADKQQQPPTSSWSRLPSQTLYCTVSDLRRIVVVDTSGQQLTWFSIEEDGDNSDKAGNFERISYLRDSDRLLVSDYHSLYICDLCGRVEKSVHKFGWIVRHCVDETARRLYVADRINEYVSVYCLDAFTERSGLIHSGFTDGLSSVCLLGRQLLVSDRGANRIFAFDSDSLKPIYAAQLRCPLFLTTDYDCHVYVTVGCSGRENSVKILDSRCRLKRKLVPDRQFGSPGGLSVAADATELFVCDLDNRRIQVFRL